MTVSVVSVFVLIVKAAGGDMEHEFVWFVVLVLGFAFRLIIYLVKYIKEREER